jgi:hypothetical protein
MRSKKEDGFIWAIWNKVVVVNLWRVKANGLINQGYLLCENEEESIMHRF